MKQKLLNSFRLRAVMFVAMMCAAFTGAWADDVTDVLNQTLTGISSSGYAEFSGKKATSDAVYAGQCAGSYSSIQLRSNNNNSGVVTTTSGGKVKSITVVWESNTVSGRTLNIYGSNTAYTAATDLYNASKQGTLLGTIVKGTSTSLTIEGDYEYIGFRSNSGALYLTSVSIVWAVDGGGDTPVEKQACDLALTGAPIALTFDMYDNYQAQYISYTSSSTGEITAESNAAVSCNADPDTKQISVTPLGSTNGEPIVITLNQAADDNYNAGSVTFTVTVTDSTPGEDPDPQPQTGAGTWVATSLADLTSTDVFVIVGNNGSYYALSSDNGTNSAPSTVAVTVADGKLTGTIADNIKWNISGNASDGYIFYPAGDTETWLYCTATNNGVRVGTNDNKTFSIDEGYLVNNATSRYVGIYNSQDWRCYTSINNNIKDQTFTFYKYEDSTDPSDTRTATTTTIDATGITNTNVFDGTAAGSLSAVVSVNGGDAIDGAEVTWSGNNDDVATIAADGTVTLVAAGEVTFTATYAGDEENHKASSATYKLTVTNTDPNAPGTENNPYTVAKAIEATPASGTSDNVYIRGIVSAFYNTSITGDGSNYRYYISDDGTTEGQLLVYRGKGLNEAAFSSDDDLQIGDEVVILGGLTTYRNEAEVAANNYIVSLNRVEKQEAGLSFGETTEFTVTLGDQFTAPTLINPNQLEGIVYISNNTEVASVDSGTGVVEIVGVGEATITVSFRGDDTYKAGSASYTLTVESGLQDNDLAITAPESTTLTVGDELQLTYTTSADGELTWESSNDAVLTVDEEGTVTAVAAGTATITLTQAASNTYDGAEATIEFTVKKATPAGTVADVLDRDLTEVTGTTYSEWSAKSVSSEAAYAGNSAGGNESIQLRSNNNNSGIVSTTSGGSILSVEVAWNENTSAGRTLNVYGSNTAYESAADLYDSSKQGTLLGTIVYNDGEPTSLEIDGDYEYVGVRSNSGAMYLTSVTFTWATSGKASAGFSFGETTAFNVLPNAEFEAPTLTTADGFDGTVVYSSSDEDIALVDESTGEVVIGEKEGTATITASSEATENFKAGSASYTITVKAPEKAENGLAYETTSVEANIGAAFTAPTLTNPNQLTVTYSSDNEELATVDENTGEVTIGNTVGNVTITATFAGNDEFKAGSVSYTINIIDPNNQPTYYALVAEYNGKHYAMNANGGTTWGATEVNAVNGKVINGKSDELSWDIISYGNGFGLRNKSSKEYIGQGSSSSLAVSTTIVKWEIDADNNSYVQNNRSFIYRASANGFKNYATSNVGTQDYAGYTQAYTFADGYTRDVTAGGWGTFCVDHTIAAADYSGVTFYLIAGKTMNDQNEPVSIVLQEAGELMAGVAYIFQANEGATKLIAAYSEESVNEPFLASDNNGLEGSFTGTDVAEGMYLLKDGQVVKCGTGCSIAANRAYIDLTAVPEYNGEPAAGVKMLVLTDLPTGINAVNAAHNGAAIYNMAGQRVGKTTKGLYIVNGQKVVVK